MVNKTKQHKLINNSTYIIRETQALFKHPIILWAGGKDSTVMLHLVKEAFGGKVPWPVIQIDTTFKFTETYNYMKQVADLWKLDFHKEKNQAALDKGMNPWDFSKFECCTQLKTNALKQLIKKYNADAVLTGIRWDECDVRGKEDAFSPREDPKHCRVHPVLDWYEEDIWEYLKSQKVPYNPLYDMNTEHKGWKYRSIGCYPCTKPVPPDEKRERAGRSLDKEQIMESLRAIGYLIIPILMVSLFV